VVDKLSCLLMFLFWKEKKKKKKKIKNKQTKLNLKVDKLRVIKVFQAKNQQVELKICSIL
jgi:hypothetical protein